MKFNNEERDQRGLFALDVASAGAVSERQERGQGEYVQWILKGLRVRKRDAGGL